MGTTSTKEFVVGEDKLYQEGHPHAKLKTDNFTKDKGRPKILSLSVDKGGCGWYRVRQIMRGLSLSEKADTHIIDGSESEEQMQAAVAAADVILARNGTGPMIEYIKTIHPTKKIVFDHDDNTFAILPSNQHYADHGIQDVWVPVPGEEDKPLWVTGITPGFNKYRNLKKQQELEYCIKTADLVTSPTARLSGLWGLLNENMEVVPNLVKAEWYQNVEIKDRDKGVEFRIGWQGGVSHFGDIEAIHKPLREALRKHKNAYFYSVGSHYSVLFKGFESRIRTYTWLDFQAHPFRMATLDLDLAIIPLQDQDFNTYKSEIKFTEFAALGVPCLVSDMHPYVVEDQICVDGKNCLTFKDEKEIEEKLELLMTDEKLRKRLARNAKNWVKENRDLDNWLDTILEVWTTM